MKLVSIIIWKMYFLINKRGYDFVNVIIPSRWPIVVTLKKLRFDLKSNQRRHIKMARSNLTARCKDNRNKRPGKLMKYL